MKVKFESADDPSQTSFSHLCKINSATQIECQIQSDHSLFGELLVSLEELDSRIKLNDDVYLSVLVLPLPTLRTISPLETYVSANTRTREAQTVKLQLKLGFGEGPGEDELLLQKFKHMVVDQTICRMVSFVEARGNVTWLDPNQLHCHFRNIHQHQAYCVEVSINNGKTFTDNCA